MAGGGVTIGGGLVTPYNGFAGFELAPGQEMSVGDETSHAEAVFGPATTAVPKVAPATAMTASPLHAAFMFDTPC